MKFKVIETEVRMWNEKQFKEAVLEGPSGETYTGVSFWTQLDKVRAGLEVEGEIDASGRNKKFVWPRRSNASNRDYEGEERRRNMRISFLSATERAVEMLGHHLTVASDESKITSKKEAAIFIREWRDWFIEEYRKHDEGIK